MFKVDRYAIFSNAKNHRMVVGYPLIIPTANIHHLSLIDSQRHTSRLSKSLLVCNTNCALVGVAVPLFALQKALGPVSDVSVVTMQAISGAGYPGVPSMDILDNVVPFISGEEEKIEQEARKVLAEKPVKFDGLEEGEKVSHYEESKIRISSQCNRVPVLDGHTACISLRFANREKIPSAASCRTAMAEYVSAVQDLGCASAPPQAIVVMDEDDRPQPRLDRDVGNGQSVCVGRVRGDPSGIWDILFVSLAHNTVIGAAGASILNAEAAVKQGYIT